MQPSCPLRKSETERDCRDTSGGMFFTLPGTELLRIDLFPFGFLTPASIFGWRRWTLWPGQMSKDCITAGMPKKIQSLCFFSNLLLILCFLMNSFYLVQKFPFLPKGWYIPDVLNDQDAPFPFILYYHIFIFKYYAPCRSPSYRTTISVAWQRSKSILKSDDRVILPRSAGGNNLPWGCLLSLRKDTLIG